jgi:hypothetical protein
MKSFKQVVTLILFLSLIASFVLYKSDVFAFEKPKESSEFIVSNFITQKDSLNKDRQLLIDYAIILTIDTLKLTAEKSVVKTFTLTTHTDKFLHGSKSPVLYKGILGFKAKNEKTREKLLNLNIRGIQFTTNKVFAGIPNDADLKEVIELVENNTLKSDSRLEQLLNIPQRTDFYWNRFKDSKIRINYVNNERGVLVERKKADKFLKWYSNFELRISLGKIMEQEIMSSSKSIIVADLNEIEKSKPEFLKEKKLFKQKLKKYLDL